MPDDTVKKKEEKKDFFCRVDSLIKYCLAQDKCQTAKSVSLVICYLSFPNLIRIPQLHLQLQLQQGVSHVQ